MFESIAVRPCVLAWVEQSTVLWQGGNFAIVVHEGDDEYYQHKADVHTLDEAVNILKDIHKALTAAL